MDSLAGTFTKEESAGLCCIVLSVSVAQRGVRRGGDPAVAGSSQQQLMLSLPFGHSVGESKGCIMCHHCT